MEDQEQGTNVLPIAGTVSTGKKARKPRAQKPAAAEEELGGMTLKYPAKIEAEVRELSEKLHIPLGTVRGHVEAAFYDAFAKDGRSVSDIVRDKMFG